MTEKNQDLKPERLIQTVPSHFDEGSKVLLFNTRNEVFSEASPVAVTTNSICTVQ